MVAWVCYVLNRYNFFLQINDRFAIVLMTIDPQKIWILLNYGKEVQNAYDLLLLMFLAVHEVTVTFDNKVQDTLRRD
ncbi:MAG: hypothetical protein DWQ58_14965 [Microcystis aeruginosa TA09]|nr:MAG: hypothetical protein DWQ58_14965 [Microcystis aeruginosa TA09]